VHKDETLKRGCVVNFHFIALLAVLASMALLPLLVLFGFFENDEMQERRFFRSGRFLLAVFIIIILNIGGAFIGLIGGMGDMLSHSAAQSEKDVIKSRMISAYMLNAVGTLFPDDFGAASRQCMTKALTTYIDNQWKEVYRRRSCDGDRSLCADSVADYAVALMLATPPRNLQQGLAILDQAARSTVPVAEETYAQQSALLRLPDKDGVVPPFDDDADQKYHAVFADCAAQDTAAWADPEKPMMITRTQLCLAAGCP
jgi:hypothetical protein